MLGYFFVQGEINAYRAVGKMNAAVIAAIEHAGIEERMHVAMDRLHVAADAPSYLAKGHGLLPGHRLLPLNAARARRVTSSRDATDKVTVFILTSMYPRVTKSRPAIVPRW